MKQSHNDFLSKHGWLSSIPQLSPTDKEGNCAITISPGDWSKGVREPKPQQPNITHTRTLSFDPGCKAVNHKAPSVVLQETQRL